MLKLPALSEAEGSKYGIDISQPNCSGSNLGVGCLFSFIGDSWFSILTGGKKTIWMPRARFDGQNLSLTKPVPIRVLSVPVWCRSFEENRTRLQLNPSTQILSFLDSSEQLRLRAATPPIY